MATAFDLKLLRNLPVVETLEDTTAVQLIAVVDNTATMRISLDAVKTLTPLFVSTPPENPTDGGAPTSISFSEDGVFTYTEEGWGKSPRVSNSAYWSDFDADSRFLLVSKRQDLDKDQKDNALANLGIEDAAVGVKGLVSLVDNIDSNPSEGVPTVAAVKNYIDARLAAFTPQVQALDLSNYSGDVNLTTPNGRSILKANDTEGVVLGSDELDTTVAGQNSVQVTVQGTAISTFNADNN